MTDKLPPLKTQLVPPNRPPFPFAPSVNLPNVAARPEAAEEEPYTIKCICNFVDDDGNTIYCETCDTWQHIECYYPLNIEDALREDFSHSCVECKPRALDRPRAIERQRARHATHIVEEEAADKKPKRPPSKSHKKKQKPSDLQLNGHQHGADGFRPLSSQDHAPKKTKQSSRQNQSAGSLTAKRSPSGSITKHANLAHPPSPVAMLATLPDNLEIYSYSPGFIALHKDDSTPFAHVNRFINLTVSNIMSDWLRDPEKMQNETGQSFDDVFQKLPLNLDAILPPLELQTEKGVAGGCGFTWQLLRALSPIEKDVPLLELNGDVGFQATYCADPENRWEEFTSPLPFVFFHPQLPLYIDTRKEGSKARYVRRSCRPNAVLETYLEDNVYHFWLISDRRIQASEQITIAWDCRFPASEKSRMLRLLGLSEDESASQAEPIYEAEYQSLADWVHRVLSEHGGCACDLGNDCAFARFHRTCLGKLRARLNPPKKKAARKPKTQQAPSPTSSGHATISRAASEGHVDDAEQESRSVSSSSRSKPPSRDMTPTVRHGSFDTLGILTEPTDRDKRKVAMVEDTFRRMEQGQQPPRKKKRTSEGTIASKGKVASGRGSSATQTSNIPSGNTDHQYVDAATSRSNPGSPASVRSSHSHDAPSAHSRPTSPPTANGRVRRPSSGPKNYCDASVQTDPEERAWYHDAGRAPRTTPKPRVVSLSRRLLDHRHRKLLGEERSPRQLSTQPDEESNAMEVDSLSPSSMKGQLSPLLSREIDRVSIASLASSPVVPADVLMSEAPMAPPPTPVSTTGDSIRNKEAGKRISPGLRVQVPVAPVFGDPSVAAMPPITTPLGAGGASALCSPFSAGLQNGIPSPFAPLSVNGVSMTSNPVKKKLSLSDYTKSRMNKAAAVKPPLSASGIKSIASPSEDTQAGLGISDVLVTESPAPGHVEAGSAVAALQTT